MSGLRFTQQFAVRLEPFLIGLSQAMGLVFLGRLRDQGDRVRRAQPTRWPARHWLGRPLSLIERCSGAFFGGSGHWGNRAADFIPSSLRQ